ncbi:PD-(D/E)XK nuclease superfamily protein [Geodermatophilus ruber]|uniref:PD-(D/E)XK nuclease superfamily protein n=2 Tax=Geodermatophilus ruber TaxID=504800 RepID=A0A1I4C1Y2_9ACTN|nr:PD-(D/E)XK nuclease superfamily protein [Geodermatophilus ruber]
MRCLSWLLRQDIPAFEPFRRALLEKLAPGHGSTAFYVEREQPVGQASPDEKGYVDLVILAPGTRIVLEAKVDALEHGDQLRRYAKYFLEDSSVAPRENGFVFLTRHGQHRWVCTSHESYDPSCQGVCRTAKWEGCTWASLFEALEPLCKDGVAPPSVMELYRALEGFAPGRTVPDLGRAAQLLVQAHTERDAAVGYVERLGERLGPVVVSAQGAFRWTGREVAWPTIEVSEAYCQPTGPWFHDVSSKTFSRELKWSDEPRGQEALRSIVQEIAEQVGGFDPERALAEPLPELLESSPRDRIRTVAQGIEAGRMLEPEARRQLLDVAAAWSNGQQAGVPGQGWLRGENQSWDLLGRDFASGDDWVGVYMAVPGHGSILSDRRDEQAWVGLVFGRSTSKGYPSKAWRGIWSEQVAGLRRVARSELSEEFLHAVPIREGFCVVGRRIELYKEGWHPSVVRKWLDELMTLRDRVIAAYEVIHRD